MSRLSSLIKTVTGESGAQAASQGAAIQSEAYGRGIDEISAGQQFSQQQLQPFQGSDAFEQQQILAGLRGPEAQQGAIDQFIESPGQKFIRERSERNLLRNSSAIGGLGGGNVRTALAEQGAGFAAQDLDNQYNRLAGITNTNLGAAQSSAGYRTQSSGDIARLYGAQGEAQASGVLGAAQANQQGVNNLLSLGSFGIQGALLSDENQKYDIEDLSPKECFDIVQSLDLKVWRYLPEVGLGTDLHVGPMSQNAPECIKVEGEEMLDLHSELMLIAGALQYLKEATWH